MRGYLPASLFAIIFGALETAGGLQETVLLGILNSRMEPLILGMILVGLVYPTFLLLYALTIAEPAKVILTV